MRILYIIGWNLLAGLLIITAAEFTARWLEPPGPTSLIPIPKTDPELGWSPQPSATAHGVGPEFTTDVQTTDLGLYDFPPPPDLDGRVAMLALGDSHTAATGVSTGETWPKVLQADLDKAGIPSWIYNGAVHGYSLDQYLTRFRRLAPLLKPRVVLIGFSMATDFYDVGRGAGGNFIYGSELGRVYFSTDEAGGLVEHRELVGRNVPQPASVGTGLNAQGIRRWLDQFALFRLAKRSSLAFWVAAKLGSAGVSLWPGLDTGLKVAPSADDRRRLVLAAALIGQIANEARAIGAEPVLVHIPYLAQVYDSVWNQSFGAVEGYDRHLGSARLAEIARMHGLLFVDTLPAMLAYVKQTASWVHYPIDSHPTPSGQRLIGQAVFDVLRKCLATASQRPEAHCRWLRD